ncbi:MAG: hypothetical protein BGO39_18895 [Chloroflexi bacterium 54-19]|nr:MAG: hypothetical protein BGO39_18895 [Chloroflexi bacterium 54-19]
MLPLAEAAGVVPGTVTLTTGAVVVAGSGVEVGALVGAGEFGVVVGAAVVLGCGVTVGKATVVLTGTEVVAGDVVAAIVEDTTTVVVGGVEMVAVAVGFEMVWTTVWTAVWAGVFVTFDDTSVSLHAASKPSIVTREIIARLSLKKEFFIFINYFLF